MIFYKKNIIHATPTGSGLSSELLKSVSKKDWEFWATVGLRLAQATRRKPVSVRKGRQLRDGASVWHKRPQFQKESNWVTLKTYFSWYLNASMSQKHNLYIRKNKNFSLPYNENFHLQIFHHKYFLHLSHSDLRSLHPES